MRFKIAPLVLAAVATMACSKGATIEGELSNGSAKGAYQRVSLVRNSGDSLASAVDALCTADREFVKSTNERIQALQAEKEKFRRRLSQRLPSIQQVALGDSMDKYGRAASDMSRRLNERPDTIYQQIMALVEAATDTQVEVSGEGQFRFAKRKPGKYWLYSEWFTDKANQFVAPVEARDRKTVKQSLDQSALTARLHCR
jgi:hypothetical protein